jgi:hypothetical protein
VLPADDFDVLEVALLLKTFEAAVAALVPVCFFGAFVCDNALPADVFTSLLVEVFNVFDALLATLGLVTFLFILFSMKTQIFSCTHFVYNSEKRSPNVKNYFTTV